MKTKKNVSRTETFELMVDGTPMFIVATSFQTYTLETQYRVSVNGSPVYIFAWHPVLKRITAIQRGSGTGMIPLRIDEAIGQHLYNRMAA
jgi:hypothetical protein